MNFFLEIASLNSNPGNFDRLEDFCHARVQALPKLGSGQTLGNFRPQQFAAAFA